MYVHFVENVLNDPESNWILSFNQDFAVCRSFSRGVIGSDFVNIIYCWGNFALVGRLKVNWW